METPLKYLRSILKLSLICAAAGTSATPWPVAAQIVNVQNPVPPERAGQRLTSPIWSTSLTPDGLALSPESAPELASLESLPPAPEPRGGIVDPIAGYDHYAVAPAAHWHQVPFSRVGIGADISPWGIGIKSAIVLDHYFDARLMGSFFNFDTGRFDIDGYNVDAKFSFASASASLDWYPFGSIWRISPGVVFLNSNEISASSRLEGGTSVDLGSHTYYSATANPATGATPLSATGVLGLHKKQPALTISGGFGRFIPRSNRHWSFPSEFGVAFTGAPTVEVNVSGWACLEKQQTQCSNLGDPKNPITIEFNNDLQSRLTHLRQNLNKVKIYPILSYGVVYSFNIR